MFDDSKFDNGIFVCQESFKRQDLHDVIKLSHGHARKCTKAVLAGNKMTIKLLNWSFDLSYKCVTSRNY